MPHFPDRVTDFVVFLRHERTRSDTRGICFYDAHHLFDHLRSDAGTCRKVSGNGMGTRHIRICSQVDIQHRSLSTLEQHFLSGLDRFIYHDTRISDIRSQSSRIFQIACGHLFFIDSIGAVYFGDDFVFPVDLR